jgi:hypothetical protein
LGQKKTNPMFFLGRVGSDQIAAFAAQTQARFRRFWVWVGLGRAVLNKPSNFSPL